MTVDLAIARKAHRSGLTGHELARKLGVSHGEANTLADVGRKIVRIDAHALTPAELLVMQIIAAETREGLAVGRPKSPMSRYVSARAGKAPAWCAATIRKRIFVSRHDRRSGEPERGLGFVELAGNGHVWLTPAGWALIQATEGAR